MKKIALLLYTVIVLVLAASCDRRAEYLTASGAMLGTTFQATGDITDCTAQELYRAIMQIDAEAKASMSIFDSTSLLSRINRGETDSLDEHIIYNLRLAERFSRLSEGHYDVTVKPLVDAWGFAGHEAERTPNLDSLLQFVGYRRVHIRDGRLVKDDPRVQLDFNSIAKGYTVDLVAALMERYGAKNYLVEIGGECRCQGVSSKGIPWRIGIETPFDGNMSDGAYLTGRIRMSEGGLATSGNYRRFYRDAAGNKISHTIDPTTGRSVTSRLLSATVVADNCAEADAMATMYLSLGANKAIALSRKIPDAKVYFILDDGKDGYEIYCSPAMQEMMIPE